tara:strand:- start:11871 stop:13247 length:1377 start_codon:yes stop_codon:yes gene_type:complete
MAKVGIPKGTRDFGPAQMVKRNYIFNTIRQSFQHYGFMPIETPAMETTQTLLGKYGEEGDRLIFKIMPRGEKVMKSFNETLEQVNNDASQEVTGNTIERWAEEALRYDLTVPFARFVVQHQNEIAFPFKRYQIQPVWRADRPQKGRYREFYQCDVDVVGSDSLFNEVELVQIIDEVFTNLKLEGVEIKLNNRKILTGLAEVIGAADKIIDITVAIDKLDKIGLEKVNAEMVEKGVSPEAVEALQPLLKVQGSSTEKLAELERMFTESETGLKGIEELRFILDACENLGIEGVQFDVTLARGLNYYTGAIFEVGHPDFPSSICGGGRYDDLTGIFGLKDVSGVGISFGADRIYDLLEDKQLFPQEATAGTTVLFVNFGEREAMHCLKLLKEIRKAGITAELYADAAKMKKQMKYADTNSIPFVAMVGTQEMESNIIQLKNMTTGEQQELTLTALIEQLK